MTKLSEVGTADKPLYATDVDGVYVDGSVTMGQMEKIDQKHPPGSPKHVLATFKLLVRDSKGKPLDDVNTVEDVSNVHNAFKINEVISAAKKRYFAGKA